MLQNDVSDSATDVDASGRSLEIEMDASNLTNTEAVAAAIEKVKTESALSDEARERLLKPLTLALSSWNQRRDDAEKQAAVQKSLSTIGIDTMAARAKLDTKDTREATLPTRATYLALENLLAEKAQQDSVVEGARLKLQDINNAISQRQPRRTELPKRIAEAKQKLESLKSQPVPDAVDDEDGQITEARKAEHAARLAAAEQAIRTLEGELKLIEAESELLPLRKTAAERDLAFETELQRVWATKVQSSKESRVIRDLQGYREELLRGDPEAGAPVDATARLQESAILSSQDDWVDVLRKSVKAEQQLALDTTRSEELSRILNEKKRTIQNDIQSRRSIRPSLGVELQRLQNTLPVPSSLSIEIDEINETIDRLQSAYTESQAQAEFSSGGGATQRWTGNTETRPQLPETEQRLLLQYSSDLDGYIGALLRRQSQLLNQQETLEELRALIDRHVVWIRNQRPFGWQDASSAWPNVEAILHPRQLLSVAKACWTGLRSRVELMLLFAVCVIALVIAGSRLRRRLDDLAKRARSRTETTMRPTWSAIIITIALTLPLFGMLYLIGEAISSAGSSDLLINGYGSGFKLAAYSVLPLELMRQMLRRNGLAIAHFDADTKSVDQLRQGLRVLIDLGIPLLIFWEICQGLNNPGIESALSRILYVMGMGLVALFIWQSLHPKTGVLSKQLMRHADGWLSRLRAIWFPLIIAIPLVLAGFSLAGYQYASHALAERGYGTSWLVVGTYLASGLLWRWLVMQRRNVAIALHREKIKQADRVGVDGFEIENDATLAAEEINTQTNRLFQTTIATAAIIGMYLVWSPVLPAVQALELVTLWEVDTFDTEGKVIGKQPFTLANVIGVIPILVLTWAAVRNLPGLVEGVLLERLPIDKASRYAITSLGTYLLAAIGMLWGAKAFGLEWGSIQWLVAALGVGLGFGLQEIFANFISGIILLFEQPIRVGDIITLGETTGVVSRIRIRATTVTNWDRQELVVPNKDLITGRLINWTLSDSTNRIVIHVGIAYGSDTQMACDLLREICADNKIVLDDPMPLITFEGFGDSTLNLVLRCFLASLDVRLATIHDLHTAINRRFAEAGVEIAFPQRDLHVRSLPPGTSISQQGNSGPSTVGSGASSLGLPPSPHSGSSPAGDFAG